jgi:hypothetical protein
VSAATTVVAEWFGLLCVEQNIAGSSLAILNFAFFFILKIFLSSRRMSVHNGIHIILQWNAHHAM